MKNPNVALLALLALLVGFYFLAMYCNGAYDSNVVQLIEVR
jgi:hypothetical protein